MFDVDHDPPIAARVPIPASEIDLALTAQFVVAWAGEAGEERRLGWWRSDMVSEFGGQDLFKRLLPATWSWAALQTAREAARRRDAENRRQDHAGDEVLSLYHLGPDLDERIQERLMDLKSTARPPQEALPGLALLEKGWDSKAFAAWLDGHGKVSFTQVPLGRLLRGAVPQELVQRVGHLVAGLTPLSATYPLPHFRRQA